MTSTDTQALIEEARQFCHHKYPCLIDRLTDALEASEKTIDVYADVEVRRLAMLAEVARLRSVVAGVEALAFELDNTMSLSQVPKNVARRLRSVLSDTKGEVQ